MSSGPMFQDYTTASPQSSLADYPYNTDIDDFGGALDPLQASFAVIGIVLNLIVIFTSVFMIVTNEHSKMRSRKSLRKRPNVNFYPILLAAVNIVNMYYFFLSRPLHPNQLIVNEIICKVYNSLEYILHSMAIYCIVALCCHVYSATLNRTLTVTPVIKHRYTILSIMIVLSIVNGVPIIVWGGNTEKIEIFNKNITFCSPMPPSPESKYFVVYFTSMAYFLPLVIITILYSIAVFHLHRSSSFNGVITRSNSNTGRMRAIADRRKLACASVILTISFFVSYFPTSFCMVVYEYDFELWMRLGWFRHLAGYGILFHACIVPIIWCITTDYKRYFKRLFAMRPCTSDDMSSDTTAKATTVL